MNGLSVMRIGEQEYYYIKHRKKCKVVFKYLGKKGAINIDEWKTKIDKRKHLEEVLRDLKVEEKQIRKILK